MRTKKKINYDAAVKNRDEESNAEVVVAKNEMESKEDAYNKAQQSYEESKIKFSNNEIDENQLNEEKIKCESAKNDYEIAKMKLQNLIKRL